MTAAPITATCTATFPLAGAPAAPCDRQPHATGLHTAEVAGVGFVWSDRDANPLPDWERALRDAARGVYGDDVPRTRARRIEAVGCAMLTLSAHRWVVSDVTADGCTCGWEGDDYDRHVAERLYATGALDPTAPAVGLVIEAARNHAKKLRHTPDWWERLTPEARQLVFAIDTLDAGGGA